MPNFTTSSYNGLYHFPAVLSLSSDNALEDLLGDIPFFAVGLLSFGVFTFFLTMRRFQLLSVTLYVSVLLAFIASLLDLSQILQRGSHDNTGHGGGGGNGGDDDIDSSGLIVVREIGFALSVGLRFFFFWLFVAEPPRGEKAKPVPYDPKTNFFVYAFKEPDHTGAWGRWGIPGMILRWLLLAMTFVITVLQMVWRLVPSDNFLGPVYTAESTLEIAASAIFILKLGLNTMITMTVPRSKTVRRYSTMVLALIFSIGLGIGNIAVFAFTESTLGRFLQAVELYILILFILISTFYDYTPPRLDDDDKASLPFQLPGEVKRGSTFRISPFPSVENEIAPGVPTYQGQRTSIPEVPSRGSTATRLSSWIGARRMSRKGSDGAGDRLWNQSEVEKGESPVERIINGRGSPYSYDSAVELPRETQNWKDPMQSTMMNDPSPEQAGRIESRWTLTTASSRRNSTSESREQRNGHSDPSTTSFPPPPSKRSLLAQSSYSIGSYYGNGSVADRSSSEFQAGGFPRNTDSPVYGLNGIVQRAPQGRSGPGSVARTRSSALSFNELLRQQTELDKSIAALKLLSPQQETNPQYSRRNSRSRSASPGGSRNRSNSTLGMPSSLKSEFSLSNFPDPPETFPNTPANGSPVPTAALNIRSTPKYDNRARLNLRTENIGDLAPPRMPVLNDFPNSPQSMPGSPNRSSDESAINMSRMGKIDSAGTQYDVTSFIGNLTTPGIKLSGPAVTFDKMTDIASDDGISEIAGSEITDETTMIVEADKKPTSAIPARPFFMAADAAAFPVTASADRENWSETAAMASSDVWSAQTQASTSRVPAPPVPSMKSAPASQSKAPPLRPAVKNVLPSMSVIDSSNSVPTVSREPPQAPFLSTGGNVVSADSNGEVLGRRRPPPKGAIGLPARPRLTISGPRPPPQDGKGPQGPSAFERPRPPPLILQQQSNPSSGQF